MSKYAVLDFDYYNEGYTSFIDWAKDVNDLENWDRDEDSPIKEVDIPDEMIERYKQITAEKENIENQIREWYQASKKILKTDEDLERERIYKEEAEAKRKKRREALNAKHDARSASQKNYEEDVEKFGKPKVRATDLLDLGFVPGHRFGEILEMLWETQKQHPEATKEELLAAAEKIK
jgi:hypothetical protein